MKHCPACGTEYDDALSACPACGTAAPAASGLLGSMGKTRFAGPAPEEPASSPKPEGKAPAPAPTASPAPGGLVGRMGGIRAYAAPESEPGPELAPEPDAPARPYTPPSPHSAPARDRNPHDRSAAPSRPPRKAVPVEKKRGLSPAAEWVKYGLTALLLLAFVILTVHVVRRDLREAELDHEGTFYSEEKAREELTAAGYHLGESVSVDSLPGEFSCQIQLMPTEYPFLTLEGTVDYTARYSAENQRWRSSFEPHYLYNWRLDGNWYAQTENYYVYITVLEFDGSQLHAILEARYDSSEGGLSSCGTVEQTCTMHLENGEAGADMHPEEGVRLTCSISGGYPEFTLVLTRDTLQIWQAGDSFQAVCERIEDGPIPEP